MFLKKIKGVSIGCIVFGFILLILYGMINFEEIKQISFVGYSVPISSQLGRLIDVLMQGVGFGLLIYGIVSLITNKYEEERRLILEKDLKENIFAAISNILLPKTITAEITENILKNPFHVDNYEVIIELELLESKDYFKSLVKQKYKLINDSSTPSKCDIPTSIWLPYEVPNGPKIEFLKINPLNGSKVNIDKLEWNRNELLRKPDFYRDSDKEVKLKFPIEIDRNGNVEVEIHLTVDLAIESSNVWVVKYPTNSFTFIIDMGREKKSFEVIFNLYHPRYGEVERKDFQSQIQYIAPFGFLPYQGIQCGWFKKGGDK